MAERGSELDKLKRKFARRRTLVDLNLDLDYVVDEDDRRNPNFKTNSILSISLLRTAMNATKAGKEGHKSRDAVRVAGKFVRKLTLAKSGNAQDERMTTVALDGLELKHGLELLKAWLDVGVPEPLADWFEVLMVEFERALAASEAAVESAKNGAAKTAAEPAKLA